MPVANVAYNDVLVIHKRVDIDRVWYSLQSFLIAFANISKIFWIKKQSPYEEREPFLRKLLDVDDSSPFKVRDPRNHFELFDERIDDWYLCNLDHNFADANIRPHNFLSSDMIKNLIYGDVSSRIDYHRGF